MQPKTTLPSTLILFAVIHNMDYIPRWLEFRPSYHHVGSVELGTAWISSERGSELGT